MATVLSDQAWQPSSQGPSETQQEGFISDHPDSVGTNNIKVEVSLPLAVSREISQSIATCCCQSIMNGHNNLLTSISLIILLRAM